MKKYLFLLFVLFLMCFAQPILAQTGFTIDAGFFGISWFVIYPEYDQIAYNENFASDSELNIYNNSNLLYLNPYISLVSGPISILLNLYSVPTDNLTNYDSEWMIPSEFFLNTELSIDLDTFYLYILFNTDLTRLGTAADIWGNNAQFWIYNIYLRLKLFNNLVNLKFMGSDPNYLRIRSLFSGQDFTTMYRDNIYDEADYVNFYAKMLNFYQWIPQYNVGKMINSENFRSTETLAGHYGMLFTFDLNPVTVFLGIRPDPTVTFKENLMDNFLYVAAQYELGSIGVFDFGVMPEIGYTEYTVAGLNYVVNDQLQDISNDFFLDARLTFIPNLVLQFGATVKFTNFQNQDPADSVGTGTTADPVVNQYLPYQDINLGIEATYDLQKLKISLGIYYEFLLGISYLKSDGAGTSWADYIAGLTPATDLAMSSYTETNYLLMNYGSGKPFLVKVDFNYQLNDKIFFDFILQYDHVAGDTGAEWGAVFTTMNIYGYYSKWTNLLSVQYNFSGNVYGIFGVEYNIFFGLPTGSQLNLTAITDGATVDEQAQVDSIANGDTLIFHFIFVMDF